MAKLSKANATTAARLQAQGDHYISLAARVALRSQGGRDTGLSSVFDRSSDYYEGLAKGFYAALSAFLMQHNAYTGFAETRIDGLDFALETYIV